MAEDRRGIAPISCVLGFIIGEIRAWEFCSTPCGWVFALSVEPDTRLIGAGTALLDATRAEFKKAKLARCAPWSRASARLPMLFFRSEGMMAGPYIQLEKDLDWSHRRGNRGFAANGRRNGGVMRLQISTGLAIFAVLELAAEGGPSASVADIGEKYGVSSHHLAKVMHVHGPRRPGAFGARRRRRLSVRRQCAPHHAARCCARLFEDLDTVEQDTGAARWRRPEGQALREVLNEIDDIARATLGSITIATMRKLVDRHGAGRDRRAKAAGPRPRGQPRL